MRDDFTNLPGSHSQSEPTFADWGHPLSDTGPSAIDLIQEIGWMDPGLLGSLLKPLAAQPLEPESETEADLRQLMKLGGVKLPEGGKLTVNWGDGSEPEVFGRGHKKLKARQTHAFPRSGHYQVLIVTKGPSAAPEFCRLTLQVRNETGEIAAYETMGMQ